MTPLATRLALAFLQKVPATCSKPASLSLTSSNLVPATDLSLSGRFGDSFTLWVVKLFRAP